MSRTAYFVSNIILILFMIAMQIGCFGSIDKRGSVRGYENGVIKTVGGNFRIGALPDSWEKKKTNYRVVLFQNRNDGATVTVSSWCKSAFDDGRLDDLSGQLHAGLSHPRILTTETLTLDGRAARMTAVTGEMDGSSVYLKTYVLKMNECVFDFLYVSTPDSLAATGDFDRMVGGFHYVKGPGII